MMALPSARVRAMGFSTRMLTRLGRYGDVCLMRWWEPQVGLASTHGVGRGGFIGAKRPRPWNIAA
jgi:hypothetical protein